ncbi:alanine--tRNA ligase [Micromonospora sp. NPDC001898]|uniref:alanine--tRNA ligase n=1 Tax=Micromonospora sp. NPDC001898 TaxID=3364221 RepID=UPI0036BB7343
MSGPMTADQLRSAFLQYFVERGHTRVASAGLIPAHPAAPLFTNAGMVQFLPYFFGEEAAPYRLATSSQKCVRVRGKHDDIEAIGRTTRHLTFFEMLGNFSFGDYFKEGAISHAWHFLTEVLGMPADRLWATVHHSDDEAAQLWRDVVGLPADRIHRLGEDNFWEMGSTGPCGPSSEIFFDKGPEWGHEGGPAHGGEERYVEIWNLVFMEFNRPESGELEPLPQRNIDTGAGMERILPIIQGTNSVFETDVLRRLIGDAEQLCGATYGSDAERDVSLRIVADHSRAISFLIADGVVPSNEERGYVLRRIIRRAALHAQRVGARRGVLAEMAGRVAQVMHSGYPDLTEVIDQVQSTLEREEHRFRETLSLGLGMLDSAVPAGSTTIPGEVAFKLHDTYGFPIDLTREIARERGLGVDDAGFEAAMTQQRTHARADAKAGAVDNGAANAKVVRDEYGVTDFLGYETLTTDAKVTGVFPHPEPGRVEVYVAASPFYPEGGGQIGDTGTITGPHGHGRVLDTDAPLPNVIRHHVEVEQGTFGVGETVALAVDADRRASLRRSHTGTHLLHWALRKVLGTQARQQGSLVAPDYLRFDFNHHSPLTDEQLSEAENLVAEQIRSNGGVEIKHSSQAEAKAAGAISFFGEKYGEVVRVIRAGEHSMELCGGTHVSALGEISELVVTSESSVGANLRRIEAFTGARAFEENRRQRQLLKAAAGAVRTTPDQLPAAIGRLQEAQKAGERERRQLTTQIDRYLARDLAREADDGLVVARCDGRDQGQLKGLALAVLNEPGISAVGLIGSADGSSVALAVAVDDRVGDAPSFVRAAAKLVGGGGGGRDRRIAVAGGRDPSRIDEALKALREALASA